MTILQPSAPARFAKRAKFNYFALMLLLAIFFVTYAPVFLNDYLAHDDWNQLYRVTENSGRLTLLDGPGGKNLARIPGVPANPGHIYMTDVLEGRLLASFFSDDFIYRAMGTVENGKYVRMIVIAFLALLAFLIYRIFRPAMDSPIHAFLLALCVCSLFPFQIIPIWVNLSGSGGALFLALGAAYAFFRGLGGEDFRLRPVWRLLLYALLACLLEASAMLLYEPFAMFYWAIPALYLFPRFQSALPRWKKLRIPLIIYVLIGFAASLIRIELPKLVLFILNLPPHDRSTSLISTIPEAWGRFMWFLREPLIRVLNFWNFPLGWVTVTVSAVIVIGCVYRVVQHVRACRSQSPACSPWTVFEVYFAVLLLILLAFSPNLLQKESFSRYRTFIGFAPVLFLLFFDGCRVLVHLAPRPHERRLQIGVLSLLSLIALMSASMNANTFAFSNATERRTMMRQIRDFAQTRPRLSGVKRIFVRQFNKDFNRTLEFGYGSAVVPFGTIPMTQIILSEMGYNVDHLTINCNAVVNTMPPAQDLLFIDMNSMRGLFSDGELKKP